MVLADSRIPERAATARPNETRRVEARGGRDRSTVVVHDECDVLEAEPFNERTQYARMRLRRVVGFGGMTRPPEGRLNISRPSERWETPGRFRVQGQQRLWNYLHASCTVVSSVLTGHTTEWAMTIGSTFVAEFDQEMTSTRRLLERVPSDRASWKPHPKSFPLGHLAQLVARMPGWIANAVRETSLDLATARGYSFEPSEALLEEFDENVREARAALSASKDADYGVEWSLTHGDRVLWAAPRGQVVRSHMNHLIHHRGQLTVYLRLNDVPLPMLYGPTADERM